MPSATATTAVLAAFVADSLSLGPHWEYNGEAISKHFGSVNQIHAPLKDFHKGKNAGDFTHYGDISLILLEHIAQKKAFHAEDFLEAVVAKYSDDSFISYRDHSVKDLITSKSAGKITPSSSEDFAIATTFFPLVLVHNEEDSLLNVTREYIKARSSSENALALGEFLARFYSRVAFKKENVLDALHALIPTLPPALQELANKAIASKDDSPSTAAKSFGKLWTAPDGSVIPTALSCGYSGAFPIFVHLLLNFPSYEKAITGNANLGGDTSGRGLALALILAAAEGDSVIPAQWSSKVVKFEAIKKIIESI